MRSCARLKPNTSCDRFRTFRRWSASLSGAVGEFQSGRPFFAYTAYSEIAESPGKAMAGRRRGNLFSCSCLRQELFKCFRPLHLFSQLDHPLPEITRVEHTSTACEPRFRYLCCDDPKQLSASLSGGLATLAASLIVFRGQGSRWHPQ